MLDKIENEMHALAAKFTILFILFCKGWTN